MTAILPTELDIPDQALALRVLVHARTVIAPGLDLLEDPERAAAVAILSGVAQEAAQRGPRSVLQQSIGSARVVYSGASGWFTPDDVAALRGLCQSTPSGDHPVGAFPRPERAYRNIWPERLGE